MRRPAPTAAPVVCSIGASDATGATGVQADVKTVDAHDAFGASVVTAIGSVGESGSESERQPRHVLPAENVEAQFSAVQSRFDLRAVKVGHLPTPEAVAVVAEHASKLDCPLVVDASATADDALSRAVDDLFAGAALVTATVDAAERLTSIRPENEAGQRLAGQRLLTKGADAALVTGADRADETVLDTLVTPETIETATRDRIDATPDGAGDACSAAITARLAHGETLPDAVGRSLAFVERAVRYAHESGVVTHAVDARNDAARDRVREQVEDVVAWFTERDVSAVVPEVGLQVVGATPYAESPADCAAVEGRITCVRDGVHPNRGVRFGVSTHVATFLLAARECVPELRYAVNCRFDDHVADAMDDLGWDWLRFDAVNATDAEESRLEREATWAFSGRDDPPVAVADPGSVGVEPIVKVVGSDHRRVAERVVALADELADGLQ